MWKSIKFTLAKTIEASKKLFFTYFGTQVIISLSSIVNTVTFKEVVDSANREKTIFGLSIFGVIVVRLVYELFRKAVDGLSNYSWAKLDTRQVIYMNRIFVNKVATLDLATFENPNTVGLIQRAFSRLQFQFKYYIKAIVEVLSSAIELSVAVAIFIFASPFIALLIVIANLIPIWIRTKIEYSKFLIYRADDETKRRFGYTSNIITERTTLPEIKVMQAFSFFKERLVDIYRQYTAKQLRIEKKYQLVNSLAESLPILAIFIFSIFIAGQLTGNRITTGTFVFLFTNVFVFSGALQRLGNNLGHLHADSHFINEAVEFFNLKPNIVFPAFTSSFKEELKQKLDKPEISIENVSFSYPNSVGPALTKVNLKIPYGKNLALIGENGAGKTTLVKLLLRMYDPQEGSIKANGIDIKEIPEDLLFGLYSTLFQSFGQFNLTIKENLEMAAGKTLSAESMISYLKFSNAWEFVEHSRHQLNQQLGPEYKDGIDLSGGQWQRLAIARAYAKRAPILILDEPTSAVDAKAEMEIFDRLNRKMEKNTLLFISHRFSTIKDASRIVVLEKGKIVEDGTHEELMQKQGKYAKLYTIQAERYIRS